MKRPFLLPAFFLYDYGFGGATVQNDPNQGRLNASLSGFLDLYSMSALEEDKAEIFAYLVHRPKYMKNRAAKDPLIARKISLLKKQLATHCPAMNHAFWQRCLALHGK